MNNSQIIATTIKKLCKERNITISKLNKECGLSKNFISEMEKRSYSPSIEKLIIISNYLNVSIDYLIGREESTGITDNSVNRDGDNFTGDKNIFTNEEVSYIEKAIFEEVKKLSKSEQIELLARLNKE